MATAAMLLSMTVQAQSKATKTVTALAQAQVNALRQQLVDIQKDGIMIGHQDDPFYGTTWAWERGRSDVLETCGDYPAVMGFELGGLELGNEKNLDGVPFDRMREEIVAHYERGGVCTISWHPWNPVTGKNAWDPSGHAVKASLKGGAKNSKFVKWMKTVAAFLNSLQTTDGQPVPVIFRPWHEMSGGWFWWGKESCTPEEYQKFFRYTIELLEKQGVANCLYCYSPGGSPNETIESYMRYYPGDDCVDMMGVDMYSGTDRSKYICNVRDEFTILKKVANEHGKLVCFAETGQRNTTDPEWFTECLWEAISAIPMSYVLFWRNAWDQPTENFGPAPDKACAANFRYLTTLPNVLMLSDISEKAAVRQPKTTAEYLADRLAALQKKGYMYGHQDDTFYGLTWEWDYDKSDILATVGDYPAVMGFDLGGIEVGDWKNLDSVPFSRIREEIIKHHQRGGIITISWHPRNPLTGGTAWDVTDTTVVRSILPGGSQHQKFRLWMQRVSDFLKTLKNNDGQMIPVIFRPWHENNGSWFWWGQRLCSDEEFHGLWNMLQDFLCNEGFDNLLWSYSPNLDGNWTTERFMARYPGNDRVMLIGEDAYQWGTEEDFVKQLTLDLDFISGFAKTNGKLFAMTECGYKNIPDATWWTRVLKPVMDKFALSYFLTWRNYKKEYFGPAPNQKSADDFRKLYDEKNTLFLRDIR